MKPIALACLVAMGMTPVAAQPQSRAVPPSARRWTGNATSMRQPRLVGLRPQLASVSLRSPYETVRVLVDGIWSDGAIRDQSVQAVYSISDPNIADVTQGGIVQARASGRTELLARAGASRGVVTCRVPVTVSLAPAAPRFLNDVMPILTKAGCNAGACHGANAGKGGFHLSLLGYEPEGDYLALTRFVGARRISPAQPDNSLILRKASYRMPHGGGMRFAQNSSEYRTVRDWIANGAPAPVIEGKGAEARVSRLIVTPPVRTLSAGQTQRLRVEAIYSDGTQRDVTARTLFTSGDGSILDVKPDGIAKVVGPGEGAVVIRYNGLFAAARIVAPFGPAKPRQAAPIAIDQCVNDRLASLGLTPSGRCTDEEFLRRVTLDVTGGLPEPARVREFLASTDPKKRDEAIDKLLASPEYVDYWTLKWSDMLRNSKRSMGPKGLKSYHDWIRKSVADNKPWDRMVADLLSAEGSTVENGAANYFRAGTDGLGQFFLPALDLGESTAQITLGVRLQCARCHNHPFEKWTQSQFYQMASFFSRVEGRPGKDADEKVIATNTYGEISHPRTGQVVRPTPLDGPPLPESFKGDRRKALAEWMTAPGNPLFAPAIANRLWKHYMGRGLVEPVDDFRVTNPPTNEPLLTYLAATLRSRKFDLKALAREILRSDAYQRSSRALPGNERDNRYYSRWIVKRLTAEPLLDALDDATGARETFADYPAGTRAVQLMDAATVSTFLDAFGRPLRQTTCECERSNEANVEQALLLMNNPDVQTKLAAPTGRVTAILKANTAPDKQVEELFLATLSRLPTERERLRGIAWLAASSDRHKAAEDLLWALMNTKEFVFNH